MAGTSSQQSLKKAIGAIKDSTMVGMAKVNSEFKDLDVAILKATNHVEVLPKEKHVRTILGTVSGSRPRVDVHYCIQALARRLGKTRSWTVALKTLIVIHRALREVDHSFCEELIGYNNSQGHLLNMLHFKDDSSSNAWDNSTFIRTYALYLEECLECFRVLKYDFYRDHTRTKKFDTPDLLQKLPAMQQLLFRLLACQPVGSARYNFIVQYALSIVATESVRLYVAITDGVLNLVDKFFEMQRRDAIKALEIYRRSAEQAERLSEFFEICRSLEFGRKQKYVKIEQPPPSFLSAMEEYVKEAPQTLMLAWKPNDGDSSSITAVPEGGVKADLDTEEISHKTDPDPAPLIDLMSWDEPYQEVSESNENNLDPFSVTTPAESSQPASWELALVTTENTGAASVAQTKGGIMDRSMLDSLYEVAMAKTNPNTAYHTAEVSSNPFEGGDYYQEPFYPPCQMSYMQMAEIPQQQEAAFTNQLHQQQELPVGHDYMQMVGIPQQQATSFEQHEQSLVVYDHMQNVGKEFVAHDSENPFGNPFVEQDSLPSPPHSQSFDLPNLPHSRSCELPSLPHNESFDLPSMPHSQSFDLSIPNLPQNQSFDLSLPNLPQNQSSELSLPSLNQDFNLSNQSSDLSLPSLPQNDKSLDFNMPSLPQNQSSNLSLL